MVAILILIGCATFIVAAVKTSRSVYAQSEIYSEFAQSKAIAFTVWLLPIGFGVSSYAQGVFGVAISLVISSICFAFVFLSANRLSNTFETSGTSRTRKALDDVNHVILFVILGFIYVGIRVVLIILEIGLSDNYIT